MKKALLTDLDGSFVGQSGGTIIPEAEYEWDGAPVSMYVCLYVWVCGCVYVCVGVGVCMMVVLLCVCECVCVCLWVWLRMCAMGPLLGNSKLSP